jgi:hypothetical protein
VEEENSVTQDENNNPATKEDEQIYLDNENRQESESEISSLRKLSSQEYERQVLKISEMELTDTRKFIMTPPPKGRVVQVTILRDKSGFKNKLYPKYHIFFSENINYHVMSARKKPGSKSANYILSLSKKNFKR